MESQPSREIVADSEWETIYRLNDGNLQFASKFLVSGLILSADSLKHRWNGLSKDEKYQFARAYSAKPTISADDEEILNFLMEQGDSVVWISIAPLLPRHTDTQRVLKFLLDNIQILEGPKANFYQAIELIGDARAVGPLRDLYLKSGQAIAHREPPNKLDVLDFLQCCRALLTLDQSMEYEQKIREFVSNSDIDVRRWSQRFLAQH